MNLEIRLFEEFGTPSDVPFIDEAHYVFELRDQIFDLVEQTKRGSPPTADDLVYIVGVVWSYYNFLLDKNLFDEVSGILYRKTMDYNSDKINDPEFRLDDARVHYFPFGHASYLHMLMTKIQRIESVFNAGSNAQFEGKADSLIDIAAYLSFYYSFIIDNE